MFSCLNFIVLPILTTRFSVGRAQSRRVTFVLALHEKYRRELEEKRRKMVLGIVVRCLLTTNVSHGTLQNTRATRRKTAFNRLLGAPRKANLTEEGISDRDEWALKYINIRRLQAISEAFDDDGSGFVTIAEVNELTRSCPEDWRCVKIEQFV